MYNQILSILSSVASLAMLILATGCSPNQSGIEQKTIQAGKKCNLPIVAMPHVENQTVGMKVPPNTAISWGQKNPSGFFSSNLSIVGDTTIPNNLTSCQIVTLTKEELANKQDISKSFEFFGENPATGEEEAKFTGTQPFVIFTPSREGIGLTKLVFPNQIFESRGYVKEGEKVIGVPVKFK